MTKARASVRPAVDDLGMTAWCPCEAFEPAPKGPQLLAEGLSPKQGRHQTGSSCDHRLLNLLGNAPTCSIPAAKTLFGRCCARVWGCHAANATTLISKNLTFVNLAIFRS